jgi:N-methylhydantoinase A
VRGIGLVPAVEMPRFVPTGATLDSALRERRRVRFDGAEVDCPVYQREKIDVGATVEGPAILDQFDCTTVLCPGQVARVDDYKNLIVGMGR